MTQAEVDKITKWSDELVDVHKKMKALEDMPIGDAIITFCYREDIHLYDCIEKVAEALNREIKIKDRQDDEYPYELSITYKGVKFIDIRETK